MKKGSYEEQNLAFSEKSFYCLMSMFVLNDVNQQYEKDEFTSDTLIFY